jgi:hypothetical protein
VSRESSIPREQDVPPAEAPLFADIPFVEWPHHDGRIRALRLIGSTAMVSSNAIRNRIVDDPSALADARTRRAERYIGSGAAPLSSKWTFIELMDEVNESEGLGLHVPRQMLAPAGQAHSDTLKTVDSTFSEPTDRVICKPENGSGGSGIIEATVADLDQLLKALGERGISTIVQEYVPLEAEIRYALWRTPDGKTYRVVDNKTRTHTLVGDGDKTKQELIQASSLPLAAKQATLRQNTASLDLVVPESARVHEAHVGVSRKPELEWGLSYRQKVANVDRLMVGEGGVIPLIEAQFRHRLRRFCVDWGFTKDIPNVPSGIREMAALSVPIEHQYPFTLIGYLVRSNLNPTGNRRVRN